MVLYAFGFPVAYITVKNLWQNRRKEVHPARLILLFFSSGFSDVFGNENAFQWLRKVDFFGGTFYFSKSESHTCRL
jgi:hypothetical protein